MQFTRLNRDFPQNVVFLHHFYHAAATTEDVFDYFVSGFDVLTVLHQQQRNVFIHLVGFFWNPQQRSTLNHLIAQLRLTPLGNFHTGVFNNTPCSSAVAVVNQLSHNLVIRYLGAGSCLQREQLTIRSFNQIVVASLVTFYTYYRRIQQHAGGDNFNFPSALAAGFCGQAHYAAVFGDEFGFS